MTWFYLCNEPIFGQILAKELLEIKAIKLDPKNPYTWASGWKSPIYCDNRLVLSYPSLRSQIIEQFVSVFKKHFSEAQIIAGVATAGIPHGILVAEKLGLPFVYVRSAPKNHGLTNLIEGKITQGAKVLVIEDLVSTGGSSLQASLALKNAGFDVVGMAAIFTYGFNVSKEAFLNSNIPLVFLSEYDLLIEEAIADGYITKEDLEGLKKWRDNPEMWLV